MIAETENQLVALLTECLPGVDVASGPGQWDGAYLQTLLGSLPAVRVTFGGLDNPTPSSSYLKADATWTIYIVTGWRGGNERERRLGPNMAYSIIQTVLPVIHNRALADENGQTISRLAIEGTENLWSGSWDTMGASIYSVQVASEIVLDPEDAGLKSALADWLTAGISFDLPGEGTDPDPDRIGEVGDLVGRVDLPQ